MIEDSLVPQMPANTEAQSPILEPDMEETHLETISHPGSDLEPIDDSDDEAADL